MAVWNLGSINVDNVYRVPHLPVAGETLAATGFSKGLGGKGANMSVAMARAAARTAHIGAVGSDGAWCVQRMMEYGVDTRHIANLPDAATGHANICVAEDGENQIVLHPGANHGITDAVIGAALSQASPGDIFLTQNETNMQVEAARIARDLGLRVAYAAAPFDAVATEKMLPFADFLFLNSVEADQLNAALDVPLSGLPVRYVVVTLGADGAVWFDNDKNQTYEVPAYPADVVDTTGAGDTFTGFALAALDRGMRMAQALDLASRAGALMVSRQGTADVIPDLKEIEDAHFA